MGIYATLWGLVMLPLAINDDGGLNLGLYATILLPLVLQASEVRVRTF